MRRAALLLLVTGCARPPDLDSIVVDISANCNEAEVQPVSRDLASFDASWIDVHAAASDGPGTPGAWLLVETDDPDGFLRLYLQHYTGDSIDTIVPLPFVPGQADELILRPGPTSGEAYLILRGTGVFQIWQVDIAATDGLVNVSGDLGRFPMNDTSCRDEDDNSIECDTSEWFRELVFLKGDPFIVGVPPQSPNVSTGVWIGTFSSLLTLEVERRLNFEPQCDMSNYDEFIACESIKEETSHPNIEAVAVSIDPRPDESKMFLFRETQFGQVPALSPDVVLVELKLDDDVPIGQLISLVTTDGPKPVPGPPAGIAIDDFAGYLAFATNQETARMLRVANGDTAFESLEYEIPLDATLVQLDADLAYVQVDKSELSVTKIFPDSPEQSKTTVYDAEARIRGYEPAGPGAALLHLDGQGPDLIRIVCKTNQEEV